jgi:hypothetical protein
LTLSTATAYDFSGDPIEANGRFLRRLGEVRQMTRALGLVIVSIAALGLIVFSNCGMRPPKDFHEAADVEDVDLDPIPDKPEPPEPTDAGVDPDGGPSEPPPDSERAELPVAVGLVAVPTLTVADLLGKTREEVESLLAPIGPEDPENPEGWIRYSDHLKLLFAEETVTELIQEVPEGKSCVDAARWIGFPDPAEPVQAADSCRWPDDDDAHELADGVGGELPRSGLFHAWAEK